MVKANSSHKQIIKKHLSEKNTINSYDAFLNYGISRLSIIIEELISEGVDIKYTREKRYNKYGEIKEVLNYWI
jgi:hypothetical protein